MSQVICCPVLPYPVHDFLQIGTKIYSLRIGKNVKNPVPFPTFGDSLRCFLNRIARAYAGWKLLLVLRGEEATTRAERRHDRENSPGCSHDPDHVSLHIVNEMIPCYLLTATVSRAPIAGTVRPTTAAICRTWSINSSNWSGNSDCGPSESALSGWW